MMIVSSLSLFLLSATTVSCLPQPDSQPERIQARAPAPVTIPLVRRAGIQKRDRSIEEWAALSSNIRSKFNGGSSAKAGANSANGKRSLVTVSTTNQQLDTSYFGQIQVGTPPRPYNVILDTGSSDLWLASESCARCAAQSTGDRFDISSSSSFQTVTGNLDVTYGSGQAVGTLGQDVVSLGGFQVSNQIFGVATSVTNSFLTGNISGLMGLAFESLASTQANPWWEAASTAWTAPQMSFYMTRFRNTDAQSNADEPGGQFTMGGTNSSLYDGNINFVNLVKAQYWTIPMTALGTQGGSSIAISGSTQNAAIDTGTTLIGGPSSVLDQFYQSIPGSALGTSLDPSLQDYYLIPCDANIQAQLTFGGQVYTMTADDLIGGTVTSNGQYCLGAFFQLDIGGSSSPIPGATSNVPTWVVGSAFLKNVYTVFQSNPAAVGFATLKSNVQEIGQLGPAGFAIDQNGNTNGTIIPSSSPLSRIVPGTSGLALLTAVLGASLTAAFGLL